jgi:DNA invertase Pin-like site-specific DNA recombinase
LLLILFLRELKKRVWVFKHTVYEIWEKKKKKKKKKKRVPSFKKVSSFCLLLQHCQYLA